MYLVGRCRDRFQIIWVELNWYLLEMKIVPCTWQCLLRVPPRGILPSCNSAHLPDVLGLLPNHFDHLTYSDKSAAIQVVGYGHLIQSWHTIVVKLLNLLAIFSNYERPSRHFSMIPAAAKFQAILAAGKHTVSVEFILTERSFKNMPRSIVRVLAETVSESFFPLSLVRISVGPHTCPSALEDAFAPVPIVHTPVWPNSNAATVRPAVL